MKTIILVLLLSVLIHPVMAYETPVDAGKGMIKDGMNSWLISLGDDMYKAGNAFSNSSSNRTGNVSNQLIFSMLTFPYDPFADAWVLSTRNMTAFIFLFMVLMYVFVGGAYVLLHILAPGYSLHVDWLGGFDYQSFSFIEYVKTLASGVLILIGAYTVIYLILLLNYALTSMITFTVLDSIAPTPDNAFLYLMMAIIYLGLAVFMAWRVLVIGLTVAFILVIGGLYLFQPLRNIAVQLFYYYCIMVFMQFILITIASGGIMIIQGLPLGDSFIVYYFALGLLLFLTALTLVMGPVTIMRFTKTASRGVSIIL